MARQGPGRPRRWMAALDRIRLTGLLRKAPLRRGFLFGGRPRQTPELCFWTPKYRSPEASLALRRRIAAACAGPGDALTSDSQRGGGAAESWGLGLASDTADRRFRSQCGSRCCPCRVGRHGAFGHRRGADRARHHALGRVRLGAAADAGRPAGEDVRRADAAVQQRHADRPRKRLQARARRALRARRSRSRTETVPHAGITLLSRRVQRAVHLRGHARRRHLGCGLGGRGGPRPAARRGALHRSARRDRRARAERDRPDRQPGELHADRSRPRTRSPSRRAGSYPPARSGARRCTTSTSTSRASTPTSPATAGTRTRTRAPTSTR